MPNSQESHELPRVLNVSHATSIVVGIISSSGIFLEPREMMAAVGSPGMVYAAWIVVTNKSHLAEAATASWIASGALMVLSVRICA